MDVIGNNIANVNTYGFKSSRATFADVYYQNVAGSKAGQAQVNGGKNPTQIGYGASVATIDVLMNVSGSAQTDRALDVHITGEGFLVTKDVSGRTFYSRMGNMGFDAAGNLVDGNGYLVQGFPMKPDPDNPGFFLPDVPATGIADSASLRGIWCAPQLMERMTGIAISPTGQITGLLAGEQTVQNNASVNWIQDFNLPSSSSYSGTIQWSVSALYTVADMTEALGFNGTDFASAVKEVQMGTVALPVEGVDKDGNPVAVNYRMYKNGNNIEIQLDGASPPMTLVGTLRNNQIVFMSGNYVAMTVKLDPLMNVTMSDIRPEITGTPTVAPVYGAKKSAQEIMDSLYGGWNDLGGANDADIIANPKPLTDILENEFPDWAALPATPTNADLVRYETAGLWTYSGGTPLNDPGFVYNAAEWAPAFNTTTLNDAAVTAAYPGWAGERDSYEDLNAADYLGTGTYTDYATVTAAEAAGANPANFFVQTGTSTTPNPKPFVLELYEQIKTTDKGGNTVIRGRDGGEKDVAYGTDRNDVPTKWESPATGEPLIYGDFSFTLDSDNISPIGIDDYFQRTGFNEVIATAGADEEQAFIIGQLVLAKFQNAAGLSEAGISIFQATNNSGEPILVVPGLEGTGATQAGKLEMSNVDISKEFTDMITTQRGFQANTRIVTVSDEMLQELVNLKR
jgi:flagellar hook protein FlgE